MELKNPIAVIVCLILLIILFIINSKKKIEYTEGKKVANTKYIKETDYYKSIVRKYNIFYKSIMWLSVISIILTSVLVARPITILTKSEEKYNRDIIIGLDVSTSQCEVNLELVKHFKEIIPNIEGDRIGIVLFNTSPITFCPLTDDYDYINERLDTIEEQMQIAVDNNGQIPFVPVTKADEKDIETYKFWYGGILANNDTRGSSLVGDGLAGTVFSFPEVKTDSSRTRIIIFATDNAVDGEEAVTLEDACSLCNKYNINLYAYCPTVEINKYTTKVKIEAYKKAVEQYANGKFYNGNLEQMSSSIVKEIKDTKTSLQKTSKKTIITDHPETLFLIVLIIFVTVIILEKRVKL